VTEEERSMDLTCIPFDPDLAPGAANALNVCLRLAPEERITVITDVEALEIAAALVAEIETIGSPYRAFVLEEEGERPLSGMPEAVLADLEHSQVSVFAAAAQTGELGARIAMTEVVNRRRMRHGHMVNIDKAIMREGMRADFDEVDQLSTRLIERARAARSVRVTSRGGTDLVAEFSPSLRWVKTSGLITAEKWGNLPGGEIFTSPLRVDGRFVVDGVVGDYLCRKYGDLRETPLTIDIEDSRIVAIACAHQELLSEFHAYVHTDPNSNRVGEFAFGTNTAVRDVIGNILQDEKIPGMHMAFGHPYASHTGADWASSTHIDCVGRECDIWFDGEAVMAAGRYLI
jgi:leucyl aminopeptidase (aminopeptidase T)